MKKPSAAVLLLMAAADMLPDLVCLVLKSITNPMEILAGFVGDRMSTVFDFVKDAHDDLLMK